MNSIHLERKRKRDKDYERKLSAHRRKKHPSYLSKSYDSLLSTRSSLPGSSVPGLNQSFDSAGGQTLLSSLIDATGKSHQELHQILVDRRHPARRNNPYLKHGVDRKVFSPIQYSRPYTSPGNRPPPRATPVKNTKRVAAPSTFLPQIVAGSDISDDSFGDVSDFDLTRRKKRRAKSHVPFPSEERLSYLLPSSQKNSRGSNRKRKRRWNGSSRTSPGSSPKYDSQGRRKPNPELLLHLLEREHDQNIRRGYSVPFFRFFGSKGNFQQYLEDNDKHIRSKNDSIVQKVHELKNQDAFEKRLLSEIRTHIRREKIRKMFKSQQQNNLIRDMKIFGGKGGISSPNSGRRWRKKMRKTPQRRRGTQTIKKGRRRKKKKKKKNKKNIKKRYSQGDSFEGDVHGMSPIYRRKKNKGRFFDDDDDNDDEDEDEGHEHPSQQKQSGGGKNMRNKSNFLNEWMKEHEEAVSESFHGSRGNTPRGSGLSPSPTNKSPKDVFGGVKSMDKLTTTPGRYGGTAQKKSPISEVEKYRRKYDKMYGEKNVSSSTGRVMFLKKKNLSAWMEGEEGDMDYEYDDDDMSTPGGFFASSRSSRHRKKHQNRPYSQPSSTQQHQQQHPDDSFEEEWTEEDRKRYKRKKQYEKYCKEVTSEIKLFERRRLEREEYQEEMKDIKVSNQKLRFSKRIGKTKHYFNDPTNVYF